MSGRRPNTEQTNKLHGTKGAVNENQVEAPTGAPEKPELSPIASGEWDTLCYELSQIGALSQVDRGAIEMASRYYAHYLEADAAVQKDGLIVVTKSGTKANPSIRARDDSARIRKAYLESLGLTPASRSRVSPVTDSDDADDLDRLLSGGEPPMSAEERATSNAAINAASLASFKESSAKVAAEKLAHPEWWTVDGGLTEAGMVAKGHK
jgi:P27 family predicted phage terminase small subunit